MSVTARCENPFYALSGPLDIIPTEKQTRVSNFSGFQHFVRKMGVDPRRILERHGMDPQLICDPDFYIDCQDLVDVLQYCSTLFNDPLFGLRLAQQQTADVFGCVTALCRAAATFREAINCFIAYIPVIHSPVPVLELVEDTKTTEFRWTVGTYLGLNDQANFQAVLLEMHVLRLIGGQAFRPSYVNLAVDARARDIEEIESILGCRFHNRSTTNAIAFPTAMLDLPVSSANRLLFSLLGGYLDRVRHASEKTIVQRVQDYVHSWLSSGSCSIEHCATKLTTSVRTLQAQLSDRGLMFSDILERQRIELAKRYLEQDRLSLDDVAAMLGYSAQSTFGRAFKRWTSTTPNHFRAMKSTFADGAH
jgi:AraC-like DNA-binding protein